MNNQQKIILETTLTRIDKYIDAINSKAAFIITFNTFLLGTIIFKYSDVLNFFDNKKIMILVYITIFFLFVAICCSLLFCFLAVKPYLKSGNRPGNYNSLLFFGSIAEMDEADYMQQINSLDAQMLKDDICRQNYTLSKGLNSKFNNISRSLFFYVHK